MRPVHLASWGLATISLLLAASVSDYSVTSIRVASPPIQPNALKCFCQKQRRYFSTPTRVSHHSFTKKDFDAQRKE
jgi:hypothetical protein